jgi:hypothetical protein
MLITWNGDGVLIARCCAQTINSRVEASANRVKSIVQSPIRNIPEVGQRRYSPVNRTLDYLSDFIKHKCRRVQIERAQRNGPRSLIGNVKECQLCTSGHGLKASGLVVRQKD